MKRIIKVVLLAAFSAMTLFPSNGVAADIVIALSDIALAEGKGVGKNIAFTGPDKKMLVIRSGKEDAFTI